MPRLKSFTTKEEERVRRERIAQLPPEVRQAITEMEPEEQDQYLASLDKAADLEARGEKLPPPDISETGDEAPYGRTKDGKPKAKPGRKPAEHPGARTTIRPSRKPSQEELEASLADLPPEEPGDDDPDEPVSYGRDRAEAPAEGQEDAPKAPTAEEREAAERAAAEAELAKALEKRGQRAPMAGPFAAVKLVPQGDPEDLENYRVDRVDMEIRILDSGKDYLLQLRHPGEEWATDGGGLYDPTSSAVSMARKRIKPVDSDAFGLALARLPNPHPARAHLFDRGPRGSRKMTPAEREKRDEQIQGNLRQQREAARRRERSRVSEGGMTEDLNFLDLD